MAKGEVMRDGAHLVGSIPLDDAETVFRRVADVLGPSIARIPDGETGERTRIEVMNSETNCAFGSMTLTPERLRRPVK